MGSPSKQAKLTQIYTFCCSCVKFMPTFEAKSFYLQIAKQIYPLMDVGCDKDLNYLRVQPQHKTGNKENVGVLGSSEKNKKIRINCVPANQLPEIQNLNPATDSSTRDQS